MTHAQQMLQTSPSGAAVDASTLVECIEACFDCAQSCTAFADVCLGEDDPKALAPCIRLNLDCADVCERSRDASSPVRRPLRLRWPARHSRPAPKPAAFAVMSASNTASTAWSTARFVARCAAVASRPATTSSRRWELSSPPGTNAAGEGSSGLYYA